jgi:hypothetical protein
MGVSTNAILFYGFLIEEDSDNQEVITMEDGGGTDRDNFWARKFNLPENDWETIYEHQGEYPVRIGTHCSGDYPMYYIAIRASEIVANRGYPEELKAEDLVKKLEWDNQLREFCKIYGLTPPEKFGWCLASYWSS